MTGRAAAVIVVVAALSALLACTRAAAAADVTVIGSRFRVTLPDGSVVPEQRLPGVILSIGDGSGRQRRIRIDAVEPDPLDRGGDVLLYTLSEQATPGGAWQNLCHPGPDGRRAGFPLAGAFTADMRHMPAPGRFLITCTAGAEGKCIRFGYQPWRTAPDGASLAPYYQACVRLVRADYCGDGVGHTRNGTPIDIFDRIGILADEPAPGMTLEAAWGPDGAICVRHTRLPDVLNRDQLAALCSDRLATPCDEATPALLYVRSFGK